MLQLCTQNFNATAMDVTGGGLNFFLNYCFPFLRLLKKFLQSSNWLIHKVSCVLLSAFQFHSSLFVLHKKWKRPKGFYQHSFNMCKIIEISWLLWVGHVAFQSCFRNQSSYNCFPIRSLGEETKRKWTIPLTLQFHSGPVILLSLWGHLSSETLRWKGGQFWASRCLKIDFFRKNPNVSNYDYKDLYIWSTEKNVIKWGSQHYHFNWSLIFC